jgi:hypothetical protein
MYFFFLSLLVIFYACACEGFPELAFWDRLNLSITVPLAICSFVAAISCCISDYFLIRSLPLYTDKLDCLGLGLSFGLTKKESRRKNNNTPGSGSRV